MALEGTGTSKSDEHNPGQLKIETQERSLDVVRYSYMVADPDRRIGQFHLPGRSVVSRRETKAVAATPLSTGG